MINEEEEFMFGLTFVLGLICYILPVAILFMVIRYLSFRYYDPGLISSTKDSIIIGLNCFGLIGWIVSATALAFRSYVIFSKPFKKIFATIPANTQPKILTIVSDARTISTIFHVVSLAALVIAILLMANNILYDLAGFYERKETEE